MSDAPPPPVSPGTDVSALDGFMLNVERLLASELLAIGTPEECWAALMLWCRAWKQVPAGSLPNDERILASFSGTGKRWAKVREVALHGFVLCSDGRLYHRFLCTEVVRASARQAAYRERREADRKRLTEWREQRRRTQSETPSETHGETCFVAEGTGTGREERKKDSDASASGAGAPAAGDPVKQMWDRGLAILGDKNRSLLGKYAKQYGKPVVLAAIIETEKEQPIEAVPYFIECCERRHVNGRNQSVAYDILARAAIEHDEREGDCGPFETPH